MKKAIIILICIQLFGFSFKSYASEYKLSSTENKFIFLNKIDNYPSLELNQNNKTNNLWVLSIFVPGLGQLAMGDISNGLFYLISESIGMVVLIEYIYLFFKGLSQTSEDSWHPNIFEFIILFTGWIFVIGVPILYAMNINDAYKLSKKQNDLEKSLKLIEKIKIRENNITFQALSF